MTRVESTADVLVWVLVVAVAWTALSVAVAAFIGAVIRLGDRDNPRHVAPRAPRGASGARIPTQRKQKEEEA